MALRTCCRADRSIARALLRQQLAPGPSQFSSSTCLFLIPAAAPPAASFPTSPRLFSAKGHNHQTRYYAHTRPPRRETPASLSAAAAAAADAAADQVQQGTRAQVPTVAGARPGAQVQPRAADFEVYEDDEDELGDAHRTNIGWFASFLRGKKTGRGPSYFVYTACDKLLQNFSAMADYAITPEDRKSGRMTVTDDGVETGTAKGLWHDYFGLSPTFSTWSQVTMLHLYLVVARMRALDRPQQRVFQKQLLDNFFLDAEERMKRTHAITKTLPLQKHLKDLFTQWRGLLLAYDEGLVRGDAVLAAAVWRNLFGGNPDVDARKLAAIVCWMRECLYRLERLPDNMVLEHADAVLTTVPVTAELARLGGVNAELARKIGEAKGARPKALMGDAANADGKQYSLPGGVEVENELEESLVAVRPASPQTKPAS